MIEKQITTTLNAIRKHSPCEDDWADLLKFLGKTKADSKPLKFSTILESNGIDDALWCLRSLTEKHHPKIRHLAADYAERVLPLFEKYHPEDKRPREAIQAARDFADGKITEKDLAAAWAAAGAAAWAAAGAAAWAAWAAAWAAAEAAAEAAEAAAEAAWAAEKKMQVELLIKYFG